MAGQVAYYLYLMAQAGMTRAPWAITTIVSCLPVLVLGMGTALAHMLRVGAETMDVPDSRTGPSAVLRSLAWSSRTATDQATDGERPVGTGLRGRVRMVLRRDHDRAMGARDLVRGPGSRSWIRPVLSPEGSPQRAGHITASVAQRRSHGLQPGPERRGAPD
jgi:hypothetical protein